MLAPGLLLGGGRSVCKGNSSAFVVLIGSCAVRICGRKMVWTTIYDKMESEVVLLLLSRRFYFLYTKIRPFRWLQKVFYPHKWRRLRPPPIWTTCAPLTSSRAGPRCDRRGSSVPLVCPALATIKKKIHLLLLLLWRAGFAWPSSIRTDDGNRDERGPFELLPRDAWISRRDHPEYSHRGGKL